MFNASAMLIASAVVGNIVLLVRVVHLLRGELLGIAVAGGLGLIIIIGMVF